MWTSAGALFFIVIVPCAIVYLASADSEIKNYVDYLTRRMIFLPEDWKAFLNIKSSKICCSLSVSVFTGYLQLFWYVSEKLPRQSAPVQVHSTAEWGIVTYGGWFLSWGNPREVQRPARSWQCDVGGDRSNGRHPTPTKGSPKERDWPDSLVLSNVSHPKQTLY